MAEDSLEDYELEVPDILWDIYRETIQPTSATPSFYPTPLPSPPPSPGPTSAPLSSPSSDPTITLEPTNTFYRVTAAPVAQLPFTYSPTTPLPTVTSSPTSTPWEFPSSSSPVEVRTYFSCPPPPYETVQHGTKLVQVETQVSTVGIEYVFQVQIPESKDIITILPIIEFHLESTLGEYLKSHTDDGYDENECGGYNVEDFRQRKLTNTTSTIEDEPTKIVAISRVKGMSVDGNRPCEPENENCHVIYGRLEATYIGNNEAGVKSSISRVIKDEVVDKAEYEIQYMQADEESYDYVSPDSKTIPVIVNSAQAITPESLIESSRLTIYGMGILAGLGAAFIVLCLVLFIKPGGSKKKKYAKRELKDAKRRALGEGDDSMQSAKHFQSYDMESVNSNPDAVSDDGIEVEYLRKFDCAIAGVGAENAESIGYIGKKKRWWKQIDDKAKVAVAAIAANSAATASVDSVDSVDSSHDSGKTKKRCNKANGSVTIAGIAKDTETTRAGAPVAAGNNGSCNSTKTNQTLNKVAKKQRLPPVVVEDVDEESKASDSEESLQAVPTSEQAACYQFSPLLPNFFPSGNTPIVNRLPSTLSESSIFTDESRASHKLSSLTLGSNSTCQSPKLLNPSAKLKLPSISEADLRPPKTDTPHVGFFQRPRVRLESPSGFTRSPSLAYLNSIKTEKWDGEGEI